MKDFELYFTVGLQHILTWEALDHILFVIALCLRYQFNYYKKIIVLITAFTIGHCTTLVLSSLNIINIKTSLTEFFIALTIVFTAINNIFSKDVLHQKKFPFIYFMALIFGMIHGLGFAYGLKSILGKHENIFIPLFALNTGIEIAQILIALVVLFISFIFVTLLHISPRAWILFISGIIFGLAMQMVVERNPFSKKNNESAYNNSDIFIQIRSKVFYTHISQASNKSIMKQFIIYLMLMTSLSAFSQSQFYNNPQSNHGNRFEDLGFLLPTPNEYRTASGAPGSKYWQQKADYDIDVTLDEPNNYIYGKETVTYFNQSPDKLDYIWIQLDENIHNPKSDNNNDRITKMGDHLTDAQISAFDPGKKMIGYGDSLTKVTDASGKNLKYTIVQTMMRIDLLSALMPGQQFVFKIDWSYKINNKAEIGGRGGYENFSDDGNNLYSITQWYPRMAVYSDFKGWQQEQFTGGAEFALVFGDFKVKITTPADHIVAATGVCTNLKQMITPAQYNRWSQAHSANEPVEIVTLDEAKAAEKKKSTATKNLGI